MNEHEDLISKYGWAYSLWYTQRLITSGRFTPAIFYYCCFLTIPFVMFVYGQATIDKSDATLLTGIYFLVGGVFMIVNIVWGLLLWFHANIIAGIYAIGGGKGLFLVLLILLIPLDSQYPFVLGGYYFDSFVLPPLTAWGGFPELWEGFTSVL